MNFGVMVEINHYFWQYADNKANLKSVSTVDTFFQKGRLAFIGMKLIMGLNKLPR